MTHPPRHLALATLFAALVVSPALADDSWVGKRVITTDGTVLMDDEKVVAASGRDHGVFRVYRVDKVDGDRLRLIAEVGDLKGWAPAENVLTFDQAIDYFTSRIKTDPTESKHYVDRGAIRLEKKEFDVAIGDLDESIRLDPKNATAYFLRGSARGFMHDHDDAIADFSEVIRLDPNDALAYFNRGLVRSSGRDYDDAIADFTEAIRLKPMLAFFYVNRGVAWTHKKEYDKAMADYGEAIRLDPKEALTYLNRGLALNAKKEYAKALADFNMAVGVDPKDARTYQARASIWATCPDKSLRDGKRAVESATKACELTDWKAANVLLTLATAYAEVGDYTKAIEWQTKANNLMNFQEKMDRLKPTLKVHEVRLPFETETRGTASQFTPAAP